MTQINRHLSFATIFNKNKNSNFSIEIFTTEPRSEIKIHNLGFLKIVFYSTIYKGLGEQWSSSRMLSRTKDGPRAPFRRGIQYSVAILRRRLVDEGTDRTF